MRSLVAALGAVALTCAAVSGCNVTVSKPTVSKDVLEKDITDRLTEQGEDLESVTCGEDLVGEVGKTTRCELVFSETNSIEAMVEVTSVDGDTVNYEVTPALSKEQLEKSVAGLVEEPLGESVESVDCESGLEGDVGAMANCDVEAGGVPSRWNAEVDEVDGLLLTINVVPVLTKPEIERSLSDQLAQRIGSEPDMVDCADELTGKEGTTIDCVVVAGSETETFTLTVTTVEGAVINYRFESKS